MKTLLDYLRTRCADFGNTTPVRIHNMTTGEIIDDCYGYLLYCVEKGDTTLGTHVAKEGYWNGNAPCAFSIKTVTM